jgi:transcriptional regulator with GAF, ATPase, and Fis domain
MGTDSDPDRTLSRAATRQPVRKPSEAVLRAVHPPGLDWSVHIAQGRTVIGRISSDDEVPPLTHETVSRSHFAVEWDSSVRAHVGTDQGSHNGSRINGVPTTGRHALTDGAVLQLGDVLVVYETGRGVTTPEAPEVSRDNVPGEAPAMKLVRSAIARAAPDPSPVLIIGETGTGKEWIAQEIHRLSEREGPMVAINCSALSPQIIDSQLFGHIKGAFTGASADQDGLFRAADKGTLFLDEIGELPLELQPKLLRVLQEGRFQAVGSTKNIEVDVRVIAATNRDLSSSIEEGQFRRDLYARLALWEIRVPALRDRRGDVLAWVERLYRRWVEQRGQDLGDLVFLPDAAETLLLSEWKDNLRGVDRLVHELSTLAETGRSLVREDLPPWLLERVDAPGAAPAPAKKSSNKRKPVPTKEEFVAVFEELEGNVRAMAKHFGRDRRQIYRWIDAHGLAEKRAKLKGD